LVDGTDGSHGAKARLKVILETIAGTVTIGDACASLGIGEAAFHKLRTRFLQDAVTGLEPRPVGRRPQKNPEERERVQALMDEVQALRRDLNASLVREELAVAMPQLLKKRKRSSGKGIAGDPPRDET